MRKIPVYFCFFISSVYAENTITLTEKESPTIPENYIHTAVAEQANRNTTSAMPSDVPLNLNSVSQQDSIQSQLNQAIELNHISAISQLLPLYQKQAEPDPLLVLFAQAKLAKANGHYDEAIRALREMLAQNPDLNPIRIELAIVLFLDQQDESARSQFKQALSAEDLPADIKHLIEQYLAALDNRGSWQVSLNARYLNEKNVNHVSSDPAFKYLGLNLTKNEAMKPQKAHGVGYYFGIERDFNLVDSHYLHFSNDLYGKNYWDNHSYDDITNRTTLGYRHKNAKQRWAILPFYERQWYGNHRYKWSQGLRGEYSRWLSERWQLSTALEYSKNRYFESDMLNGNTKLASLTLVWQRTPRQFFYGGVDFTRETAAHKNYSYDLKTARLGWGQEWNWGISSRVSASYSLRDYKDNLKLGSLPTLKQARQDHIYHAGVTLWKRDWHLWGITPKLNVSWRKQDSNFDSLYSYSEKNVNMFFEKSF